ncbi:MAG TPA: hypothetical protein VKX40_02385 [Aequorivita sp.]|nr:hypothetical protein [Aequorivita sp.]
MKKALLFLMLAGFVLACKNGEAEKEETETVVEETSNLKTYQGEFIFTDEAAVFKGNSYIYGVKRNDMAQDLARRVAAVKTKDYDMVPVMVRGEVHKKAEGDDGWDEILTITEIITVSDTPSKNDIELKINNN